MFKRKVNAVFNGKPSKIKYEYQPYDSISDNIKLAVICAEDQKFVEHNGFDINSIEKALKESRKRTRGASTISQQTAKNIFLWEGRSWLRKGLEAYFTILIELIWGKKRILEVYLNCIEMGYMTFGAEAAAKQFYQTTARQITKDQAATIAATLPNPRIFKAYKPSPYVIKRKKWILQQMKILGKDYLKKINEM